MPKVTFIQGFDFHIPGKPATIHYKAGHTYMVTTPCANIAIAQGKARPVRPIRHDDAPEAMNQGRSIWPVRSEVKDENTSEGG